MAPLQQAAFLVLLLVGAGIATSSLAEPFTETEGGGLYWRGLIGEGADVTRVLLDFDGNVASFLEPEGHNTEEMTGVRVVDNSFSANIPSLGGSIRADALHVTDFSSPLVLKGALYLPTVTHRFQLSPCNPSHCLPPSQIPPGVKSPFNLTDAAALSQLPAAAVVTASASPNAVDVAYAVGRMSAADSRPLWAAMPPPSALWPLGEATRLLTATLIASLVHKGLLSYSEPLTSFFPDAHTSYSNVTVAHLLAHRSGLAPRLTDAEAAYPPGPASGAEAVAMRAAYAAAALARPAAAQPGADDLVSHSGYVVLGAIVDAVSEEKSFEEATAAVVTALLVPTLAATAAASAAEPPASEPADSPALSWGCPGQSGTTTWVPETIEHPIGHSFSSGAATGVLPNPTAVCGVSAALRPAAGAALRLDALQALLRLHATPYSPDDEAQSEIETEAATVAEAAAQTEVKRARTRSEASHALPGLYSRLFRSLTTAPEGEGSTPAASASDGEGVLLPPRAIAEMHYPAFPGGRYGFGVAAVDDGSYSTAGGTGWVGPSQGDGPSVYGTKPLWASAVVVDRARSKGYAVLANGGHGALAVAEYADLVRAGELG